MPTFDREALRKGKGAIQEALDRRGEGGGDYRPFLPNIYWKEDGESRYVLFLNPIEEIPEVEFHSYIDTGDGMPHMAIVRTDPCIGESSDPLHEEFGYKPKLTNLAIAVELEPKVEIVKGRKKPVGFEIKTRTFERRIRDDNDELTEEREEVTAPVVGLIAQSPYNFFNVISAYDTEEGPVNLTPLKIQRLGKKTDVTYAVTGYDSIEIDRSNLLENIENLSYVTEPVELLEAIDGLDDEEASAVIGDYLLYRRMEELADEEAYADIVANARPPKYPDKSKEKKEKKEKATRQSRPSQRRKAEAVEVEVEATDPDEPEPIITKSSPATERLATLREKSRAAAR